MNETKANLYCIVYCSRNRIQGSAAEVQQELQSILAASRKNNAPLGVTGALLYNAGSFAQILEGPSAHVEQIFERLQCDARHSEVTVIQSGFVEKRQFPEWSMAFTGSTSSQGDPVATAAFDAVFSRAERGAEQLLTVLRDLVVDEGDWVLVEAIGA